MLNKIINCGNITELENKILTRLKNNQLIFNNKIQLSELSVLKLIDTIKNNKNYFKKCYLCGEKFSIINLTDIDKDLYCNNCIENHFYNCETCGDYIYNDDIHSFNNSGYCQECFFEAKQETYHHHKIINILLLKLNDKIKDYNFNGIDFKIEGHLYSIEMYAKNNFRIGSFYANTWIDIGNNKKDLLKAIDYNLGINRDLLTNIFINDVEL